jgi:hypothetical protein
MGEESRTRGAQRLQLGRTSKVKRRDAKGGRTAGCGAGVGGELMRADMKCWQSAKAVSRRRAATGSGKRRRRRDGEAGDDGAGAARRCALER